MSTARPPRSARPPARPPLASTGPAPAPVTDEQREALQQGLDDLPEPLEPLDVSALDGFLCGVLLQPQPIPPGRWLPFVFDIDGRPLPSGFDATALRELVERRYRELNHAIEARQWFDPWIFELANDEGDGDDDGIEGDELEAVFPWVAGFATALTVFPDLSDRASGPDAQAMTEPLALIYRHLDPEDLEDAEDILAEIETLEPPVDLSAAVEELVRATLLLADVTRPHAKPGPSWPKPQGSRR